MAQYADYCPTMCGYISMRFHAKQASQTDTFWFTILSRPTESLFVTRCFHTRSFRKMRLTVFTALFFAQSLFALFSSGFLF